MLAFAEILSRMIWGEEMIKMPLTVEILMVLSLSPGIAKQCTSHATKGLHQSS